MPAEFKNYPTNLSSSYSFVKHKGRSEMGYQAMPPGGPLVESKKAALGDAYIANYRSMHGFDSSGYIATVWNERVVNRPGKNLNIES